MVLTGFIFFSSRISVLKIPLQRVHKSNTSLAWYYEGVSKSFWTESIKKYMLTTINTRQEATQRVMAAKLTRLTHNIAMELHLVAESCTTCSSRSRQPVRKLLDTPWYYSECACIKWRLWRKGQLLWGIGACIWSIPKVPHEHFVRRFIDIDFIQRHYTLNDDAAPC